MNIYTYLQHEMQEQTANLFFTLHEKMITESRAFLLMQSVDIIFTRHNHKITNQKACTLLYKLREVLF